MKVQCTKEEFKLLLDLVYAGNVLINGMKDSENQIKPYAEIEQKVFALAKEFGFEDFIEYDEEFKMYMPTKTYEEGEVNEYIDSYDTEVFWEELIMRLARRDALNYVGDVDPDMSKQQLLQMQMDIEEKYSEEFSENGLMRLKIVEGPTEEVI